MAEADVGAEPPKPASLPRNVRLLGWASLLNDTASEMIFPLLPSFLLQVLGGNKLYLGVIEGFADSLASVLKLWSGGWSDRAQKRRAFIIPGYALAALSRPLVGLATAPWHVLVVRLCDRFGKGIRSSPRDALVAESTPPELHGRAFGFNRAMDHLGAAIGPILAWAFLEVWPDQLRTLFLLTLIPGLTVVALLFFRLEEKPLASRAGKEFAWSWKPFDANFRRYLLAILLFTLGNSSDAFLLVRAEELGIARPLLPVLWCIFHIVKSSGSTFGGRLIDRLGPRVPLFSGWLIYVVVYLGFSLAVSAWQAWALFLLYAVYYALAEPAEKTMVARLVGAPQKGLAYGWFNFVVGVAALPASVGFGWLYKQWGAGAAFGAGAGLALVAAVVLTTVRQSSHATRGTRS